MRLENQIAHTTFKMPTHCPIYSSIRFISFILWNPLCVRCSRNVHQPQCALLENGQNSNIHHRDDGYETLSYETIFIFRPNAKSSSYQCHRCASKQRKNGQKKFVYSMWTCFPLYSTKNPTLIVIKICALFCNKSYCQVKSWSESKALYS